MKKKFICPICGYVHEGEEAPERCPQCKQIVEWKVVDESAALNFVTEHVVGIAKGTGDDMIKDLNAHFMGEATEVGMYLAMSRIARRCGVGHQDQPLQAHDCRMRRLRRQDAHRPRGQGAQPRRHPRHRP